MLKRSNGEFWLVEKGAGAGSAFTYEGRPVVVIYPGSFCGPGSTIYLVHDGQEAPITAAKQIAPNSVAISMVNLPVGQAERVAYALALLGIHKHGANPVVALSRYQSIRQLPVEPRFTSKLCYALATDLVKITPLTPTNVALAESLVGEAKMMAFPVLARASSVIPPGTVMEAIIDGEFNGWDGETVFRLSNRSVWQQLDLQICLHLALSPKVLFINAGNGIKAKVEGVRIAVDVIPLR